MSTKRKSIEKLLSQAEFDNEGCTNFIYTWDIFKSAKIHNKIIGNCTIEYNKVLKYPLQDYYMESSSDFANDNNAVLDAIFKYLERLKIYVRESNIENKENIVKYIDRMKNKKAESCTKYGARFCFFLGFQSRVRVWSHLLHKFRKSHSFRKLFREFCRYIPADPVH